MSPLGQLMSDWIKSHPGYITSDTCSNVLQKAYEMSPFPKRGIPFADFQEYLKIAGYEPQEKKRHGVGNGQMYWGLALPE